jgi:peptidyl-prolyl cis-trans isomerase D
MSIIQSIREKYAAIGIAVIAISLIAFILMDALSSRTNLFGNQASEIGTINGKTIDRLDFDNKIKSLEDNYRSRGMDVNDQMRQQLLESIWNNEIDQILLKSEYENLGLVFTNLDKEDGIFGENAPNEFKESFKDPKTGLYDPEAARQQLKKILKTGKDPKAKAEIENYIKEAVIAPGLRNKYINLLKGSVYYPKWLYDKEQADQLSLAAINYVNIPYTSIGDSTIKISDEEIGNYIKKNKEQFKQEKSASISYVLFDGSPTSADSLKNKEELSSKKSEFVSATDVKTYLNINSSESSFDDSYILKSKINSPAGDSLFTLSEGAVFGPYLEGNSYTLAKYINKRTLPDSVKCRHILIATTNPQSGTGLPDSVAQKKADSIAAAIATGANFAQLAAQFSDDPGSKDKGGEYDFSLENFSSLARPFAEFIFYQPNNSKSVIKTDFGYHYIEVLDQKNASDAYKFAYLKKRIIPSQETTDKSGADATKFAAEATDKNSFEKYCKDKKLTPRIAEFKTTDYTIVGLGNARQLIRWAFENKEGSVSNIENIGDYVLIALVTEKNDEGLMSIKSARPLVEPILINTKKTQQIISKAGIVNNLNEVASKFKLNVEKADSIIFGSQFVNSLGAEPKVVGASFYADHKKSVSKPISGNSGVFYIQTTTTGMMPSAGENYSAKRSQMEQNIKGGITYKAVESLKKTATIKDNRIQFY